MDRYVYPAGSRPAPPHTPSIPAGYVTRRLTADDHVRAAMIQVRAAAELARDYTERAALSIEAAHLAAWSLAIEKAERT